MGTSTLQLINRTDIRYTLNNYAENACLQLYESEGDVYYFFLTPVFKKSNNELIETDEYEAIILCKDGLLKSTLQQGTSKKIWRFANKGVKEKAPKGMEKLISDFIQSRRSIKRYA